MGKNYFQAIPIDASYDAKLISFSSSLGDAIGKDKTIPFADNDVTYTLDLQNKRIRDKDIEFGYEVYKRTKDSPLGNTFFDVEDWSDGHYKSTVGFAVLGVKRTVSKNGNTLYKDNLRRVFYGTVTDIISNSHPEGEMHSCPNCAAVSTIEELQNGCPYCGTQYKMDDLFPKISGFYFFDQLQITKKQLLIGWPVCAFICTLAIFIIEPFLRSNPALSGIAKTIFQYGPLFVIILGAAYGMFLFLFMHLLFKIAGAIVDLNRMGTAESRQRFELRMKKTTPKFSYEYFKNKAISLIKTAVYSADESELLCYKGGPLPADFKDIIDLNYAGTFGIKGFSEENGIVSVETRSYFDVLSVREDKVSSTRPVISATSQRRTDIPVNLSFSMTRIACPSCAKSFNPVKNRFCPGCGREYELITDDWVLADLKMVK